jgi:hypothetical protein
MPRKRRSWAILERRFKPLALDFSMLRIFDRPTGLRREQVIARPCFETFRKKKPTGRAMSRSEAYRMIRRRAIEWDQMDLAHHVPPPLRPDATWEEDEAGESRSAVTSITCLAASGSRALSGCGARECQRLSFLTSYPAIP